MNSRNEEWDFKEPNLNGVPGMVSKDDDVNELLAAFRQDVHQQALRPTWFWTVQRASIRERTTRQRQGSLRWALGSVFAMIVVAVAMLLSGPAKVNTTAQKVDDDLLMQQVIEATDDTMPDALTPSTLLANEVDRGLKTAVKAKGATR